MLLRIVLNIFLAGIDVKREISYFFAVGITLRYYILDFY